MTTAPEGSGRTVLVTGGSGSSGIAVARALLATGARVVLVGSDPGRIATAAAEAGVGATHLVCDLADAADVQRLHKEVAATAGPVDGVIHLVGGWRGATGIADQTDADWDFLSTAAITTLRNVSREFYAELETAPAGRFAMVSSTAVEAPAAAMANYVAAKAAAEAWTVAMAEGFTRSGSPAAAVVLVVKSLVDSEMRARQPQRRFPGATDVDDLGAAVAGLFSTPAAEINGHRLKV
ncbi:SDR family NAD(P)-dependent oxidoreductase [Pseudarthrobacter sp. J75]|uniref:SDR family NAD(P)-dependent oxidoreductase n=1 Tax=unclassified Pseudarthrobacter TaxID=2647000 RepID=UPI002E7FD719|nr:MULTISPECIES: SDR family NAD(P)-dependent oxidoreductase [unclassified Pseudarthrobacter]MEE2522679.1 SDR family NAD(P)-dependent oxidoreductase [Pseudarthrobacter sp. J47]MEE2529540.1 SDR family NAD(P)-dependent oxidoreductase [Pseudarthrobacter sp. J75]